MARKTKFFERERNGNKTLFGPVHKNSVFGKRLTSFLLPVPKTESFGKGDGVELNYVFRKKSRNKQRGSEKTSFFRKGEERGSHPEKLCFSGQHSFPKTKRFGKGKQTTVSNDRNYVFVTNSRFLLRIMKVLLL